MTERAGVASGIAANTFKKLAICPFSPLRRVAASCPASLGLRNRLRFLSLTAPEARRLRREGVRHLRVSVNALHIVLVAFLVPVQRSGARLLGCHAICLDHVHSLLLILCCFVSDVCSIQYG